MSLNDESSEEDRLKVENNIWKEKIIVGKNHKKKVTSPHHNSVMNLS